MIISEADITVWLRKLQCDMATFANTTGNAFSFRKRNRECLRDDLILLDNVIRILYDYQSFTDQPTYAYSFDFTRDSSTADTITVRVGAQTFVKAVTTENGTDLADYYESVITDALTSPVLYSIADGSTLYVWSTSASLDYSSTSTVTSVNNTVSATVSSLEDNLQTILDLWNCLTNEQLCNLICVVSNINDECDCA